MATDTGGPVVTPRLPHDLAVTRGHIRDYREAPDLGEADKAARDVANDAEALCAEVLALRERVRIEVAEVANRALQLADARMELMALEERVRALETALRQAMIGSPAEEALAERLYLESQASLPWAIVHRPVREVWRAKARAAPEAAMEGTHVPL